MSNFDLPLVPETDFTEHLGVIAVYSAATAARCIWRPTTMRDVGIDGQIEYVTPDRRATGRIALVQVKSGRSYFKDASETVIPYSPSERHRNYWERSLLPVLLCLHDPDSSNTYWVDARHEIRVGRGSPIRVPRSQMLSPAGVLESLQGDAGPLPLDPVGPEAVFAQMRAARTRNASFDMSFFDIFVHGLTDVCRSLYFGMDLVMEIAEARNVVTRSEFGVGLGGSEYEFLDEYVAFVIANDLAHFNYDWYRRCVDEMGMVATMHAPLTTRGRALVMYISGLDNSRNVRRGMWEQVVVERFVQMVYRPGEVEVRAAWIDRFESELDAGAS